jgi:Secretion system C-terminal sorting domain
LQTGIIHKKVYLFFNYTLFVGLLLFNSPCYSTTYYSKASGNWNSLSTWGTSCGSGTGAVPAANDSVIICNGYTISVTANHSITAITVKSGGTLICANTDTLTVTGVTNISGTFNMSAGAFNTSRSFTVNGVVNVTGGSINLTATTSTNDLTINGVLNQSAGIINVGHFVNLQNSGTLNVSGTASFTVQNQLKFKNTKGVLNISSGTIYLHGGVLSANISDQINQSGGTIEFDNTNSWSMNGTYNATAGFVTFNGNTTLDTVTMSASWTFFNLTINSGKMLDQKNIRNINVKGNWTNNGTFDHSGERVTFSGSVAQAIAGDSTTTFDSLTINNTGTTGVTLLRSAFINSVLTLIDGYVYTDSINLMIVVNNATSTSGSDESFISGPMKKIGNDPFVFPVGSAGSINIWARLEMVNDSKFRYYNASTEFTCRYYYSAAPNNSSEFMTDTINHVSYIEYWDLERTYDVADNAQCNVRLYWEDAARSEITDYSTLLLTHFNSDKGYYEDQQGVSVGSSNGYITSTIPLTSFSPFTFGTSEGETHPLPIELLSFDAKAVNGAVSLTWSTASEVNNDFFTIEKTNDGINFEFLESLKGGGNNYSILNYSIIDEKPYKGISYYRLKQTDYDGKVFYSELKAVNFNSPIDLSVIIFPNPSDGSGFNLQINSEGNEDQFIEIYNLYGKKMYSKLITTSEIEEKMVPVTLVEKLDSGFYMMTVLSGQSRFTEGFIVQ